MARSFPATAPYKVVHYFQKTANRMLIYHINANTSGTMGSRTKDTEKLMADVVASIVEKILMNMGFQTYNKVNEILKNHDLSFAYCYQKPDILNFALKQAFEDSYLIVVEKIREEFVGLADEHQELAAFLKKLSE